MWWAVGLRILGNISFVREFSSIAIQSCLFSLLDWNEINRTYDRSRLLALVNAVLLWNEVAIRFTRYSLCSNVKLWGTNLEKLFLFNKSFDRMIIMLSLLMSSMYVPIIYNIIHRSNARGCRTFYIMSVFIAVFRLPLLLSLEMSWLQRLKIIFRLHCIQDSPICNLSHASASIQDCVANSFHQVLVLYDVFSATQFRFPTINLNLY